MRFMRARTHAHRAIQKIYCKFIYYLYKFILFCFNKRSLLILIETCLNNLFFVGIATCYFT